MKEKKPSKSSSTHERSEHLRNSIDAAVDSGVSIQWQVPLKVFALTFTQAEELLKRLSDKDKSLVASFHEDHVQLTLAAPQRHQADYVQAMHDKTGKYQMGILTKWYQALYSAYQNRDSDSLKTQAQEIFEQSAVVMGLAGIKDGEIVGMFEVYCTEEKLENISSHISRLSTIAENGIADREDVGVLLDSFWNIIGEIDPTTQRALLDQSPDIARRALLGTPVIPE